MRGIVFAVIFVFLLSAASGAIGVSPGSYKLDFEPGYKNKFDFNFLTDEGVGLEVYLLGDLAPYAKLSKTHLDNSGTITVTLALPQEIDVPGNHRLFVGA